MRFWYLSYRLQNSVSPEPLLLVHTRRDLNESNISCTDPFVSSETEVYSYMSTFARNGTELYSHITYFSASRTELCPKTNKSVSYRMGYTMIGQNVSLFLVLFKVIFISINLLKSDVPNALSLGRLFQQYTSQISATRMR